MKFYVNQHDRDAFKDLVFQALDALNPENSDHKHLAFAIEEQAAILHKWGVVGDHELFNLLEFTKQITGSENETQ